jgi:hypothetical protein
MTSQDNIREEKRKEDKTRDNATTQKDNTIMTQDNTGHGKTK